MKSEDITTLLSYLDMAEEFRPLVRKILDTVSSYSTELKEAPEALLNWHTDMRIKNIESYKNNGFSHEEAILLTLDDVSAFKKARNYLKDIQERANAQKGGK